MFKNNSQGTENTKLPLPRNDKCSIKFQQSYDIKLDRKKNKKRSFNFTFKKTGFFQHQYQKQDHDWHFMIGFP